MWRKRREKFSYGFICIESGLYIFSLSACALSRNIESMESRVIRYREKRKTEITQCQAKIENFHIAGVRK